MVQTWFWETERIQLFSMGWEQENQTQDLEQRWCQKEGEQSLSPVVVSRRQNNFLGPVAEGEEEEKAGSGRVSSRGH